MKHSFALGNFETISGAAHGFEIARILGIDFNLFSDAADIDVDGARCDKAGIAPHCVEKMVTAVDAARMTGEVVEQAELGGGGGGELAPHRELHGVGVDNHLFKADDRWRCGTLK